MEKSKVTLKYTAANLPKIMGIININDNSFFSGSRHTGKKVIFKYLEMLSQGADIIDIGACSTRPGSIPVSEQTELEVITEALKGISDATLPNTAEYCFEKPIKISIDTFRSSVAIGAYRILEKSIAEEKIELIINDISAGEDDKEMLKTIGELGLQYIAMHKRGTPATMQSMTDYPNGVVNEVKTYFEEFAYRADKSKIREWILDPGFGFAKTVEQNYELLQNLGELKSLRKKILVGLSRKSMIYKPLNITPEEALPQTCSLNMVALLNGADILRVHDVKEAVQCRTLFELLAKKK